MHLYLLTRGVKENVDKFIKELSSKYLPWEVAKDGTMGFKKGKYQMPIHVRPVQLWEIAFPREQKDIVLTSIFDGGNTTSQYGKSKKFMGMLAALRKMLGAEKIKKYDTSKKMPLFLNAVEKIGIGTRKDIMEDGTERI